MTSKKEETKIGTQAAADELGLSRRQVQTLINRGHLPAEKLGRDWFIKPSDLELVRERPKGRPPTKNAAKKDSKPLKVGSKKSERKESGE